MKSEKRVSTAEREAHRLVKNNFRIDESGATVYHNYYLRYQLIDSEDKSISAANLPAVLRAVEDNERRQPSAEDIELWLGNSVLMQTRTASEIMGASPSAEPTSAD